VIRAEKETTIIKAINMVEFAKRFVSQALAYSFNQAAYDVASRGGYFSLTDVHSLSCIPYWKEYSEEKYPDFEENLKNSILGVFDTYRAFLNSINVNVPEYEDVGISRNDDDSLTVSISSSENLNYKSLAFEINDISDSKADANIKLFKLFDVGKEVSTQVANEIDAADSYSNAVDKLKDLEDSLNSVYRGNQIEVSLEPSKNLGSSSFAIRVLVRITDKSSKLIAFNFNEGSVKERNVQLNFYVLSGKENVATEINECKNIDYKNFVVSIVCGDNNKCEENKDCICKISGCSAGYIELYGPDGKQITRSEVSYSSGLINIGSGTLSSNFMKPKGDVFGVKLFCNVGVSAQTTIEIV
jgi:hypothetical protein